MNRGGRFYRSLAFRLVGMGVAIFALSLGALTLWLRHDQRAHAMEQVQQRALALAATAAAAASTPYLTNDFVALDGLLRQFALFPTVRRIVVTDQAGQIRGDVQRDEQGRVQSTFAAAVLAPPPGPRWRQESEDRQLIIWYRLLDDPRSGWLRLSYDISSVENALASLWRHTALASLLALLLMAGGTTLLLRGPLHSLRRATTLAGKLDACRGDSTPPYQGVTEIGQLIDALNLASQRLAANQGALRLHASVFENSREGILITDARQRILQVNSAFSDITGYAAEEVVGRTPAMLRSGRHDEAYYQAMWRALAEQRHWRGEIWNRRKDGTVVVEMLNISAVLDTAGEVSHYVGLFSDISDLKAAERHLENLAYFDRLTGLPNRQLLFDRLEQATARASRTGHAFALAFLDLDGFKPVNDTCGHEIGDQLLTQLAARLNGVVRSADTVARIGGDEFVLLLDDVRDPAEIEPTLIRVLETLGRPYAIAGKQLTVTASIGVALYPGDGRDASSLLAHADRAMYEAKSFGRNTYRYYGRAPNPG